MLLQVNQSFDLNVVYHSRYFYVVNVFALMIIGVDIGAHNKLS